MSIADTMQLAPPLPKTAFGRLTMGIKAFRRLVRNPADPPNGPLFQMCVEHGLHKKLARDFMCNPEGSRLLAERPRLNVMTVSLDAMAALPSDSLGYAYNSYFEHNGLSPFDPPVLPVETLEEYVCTRIREAHDVVHVVTGYGTDEVGEIELQCFNLGNLPWGMIPIITSAGAVVMGARGRLAKYGGRRVVWKRMRAAYRRGRASRSLGSVMWEDHWRKPVRELQELLCAPCEST